MRANKAVMIMTLGVILLLVVGCNLSPNGIVKKAVSPSGGYGDSGDYGDSGGYGDSGDYGDSGGYGDTADYSGG